MENETKQTNTNEQEPDIFAQKLREADSLYAILSGCTKEPYVYCDPETMDDAILLFTDEEGAKAGAQKLAGQQIPVGIAKVDRKSLLLFYTSLYTMGVNAIQVHVGEEQKMIQLTEFVRRKDPEESKNGKVWVENRNIYFDDNRTEGIQKTSSPFLRRTVDGKGAAVDGVDGYWIIEMRTTII